MSQGIEILCDSHHGQYIPKIMIKRLIDNGWQGITDENVDDCRYPDQEWYWEAWNDVVNNANFADENGNVWGLYHNGDLFAVCYDLMTEEEKQNFFEY